MLPALVQLNVAGENSSWWLIFLDFINQEALMSPLSCWGVGWFSQILLLSCFLNNHFRPSPPFFLIPTWSWYSCFLFHEVKRNHQNRTSPCLLHHVTDLAFYPHGLCLIPFALKETVKHPPLLKWSIVLSCLLWKLLPLPWICLSVSYPCAFIFVPLKMEFSWFWVLPACHPNFPSHLKQNSI